MSHDTPNIVADNHIAQVMSTSLEYLGQNPESVLHIFRKQDSLRKGYPTLSNQSFLDFVTGHTYWV